MLELLDLGARTAVMTSTGASHRPARNEAGRLRVLAELRLDPALDVVVADDGSSDRTAAIAAAAGAAVVRLPFNLGIGGAVQTGFKYALEHGYDVVVRLDGDGQHDPAELPKLLAARGGRGRHRRRLRLRRRGTVRPTTGCRSPGARASASSPASSRCSCARR